MAKYTKEAILQMAEEEDVEFIRLQFTDMFGMMKNMAITAGQLEKALNNQCVFDGSSFEGFVTIEEADMFLHPDLDTFAILPWRPQQGKVARLICDVYDREGNLYAKSSRTILQKVISEAKAMGYEFEISPECEFFLFHTDEEGRPTTQSHERASYFDVSPIDLGENSDGRSADDCQICYPYDCKTSWPSRNLYAKTKNRSSRIGSSSFLLPVSGGKRCVCRQIR